MVYLEYGERLEKTFSQTIRKNEMIGSYQDPAILVYDLKEILGWPELLELSEGYKWRECPTDAHIIRIMLSTLHGVIVPYAGYSGIYLCDEVIQIGRASCRERV